MLTYVSFVLGTMAVFFLSIIAGVVDYNIVRFINVLIISILFCAWDFKMKMEAIRIIKEKQDALLKSVASSSAKSIVDRIIKDAENKNNE